MLFSLRNQAEKITFDVSRPKRLFAFQNWTKLKVPKWKTFGLFNKTPRKCKVNGAAFHGRASVLANNGRNYYSIFLKVKDQVAAIYHSQLSPSHHVIVPILLEANFLGGQKISALCICFKLP